MKKVFTNRGRIAFLALAGIFILILFLSSEKGDASPPIEPDQCCRCHFEVCDQTTTKQYVHSPVNDKNCAVCHIKDMANNKLKAAPPKKTKIAWFARHHNLDTEHWFELPANAEGLPLILRARGEKNKDIEQEITIPHLDDIEPFPQPQGNSTISDIKVIEVKRGVFISAKVSWKTDRFTNSRLQYGEDDLRSNTASDSQWTRKHEMTISGLNKNRSYTVAAISHDIFGNETVSSPVLFSTKQFFTEPAQQDNAPPEGIEIGTTFFKEKERIFISFSINQQVAVKLGFRDGQSPAPEGESDSSLLPNQHLPLTDPYELSTGVCLKCHPNSKGKLSHPVHVRPKKGMTIPADYTRLADGRITCMSCHVPHAANNHYRLVRENRKDLCLGCHRNF